MLTIESIELEAFLTKHNIDIDEYVSKTLPIMDMAYRSIGTKTTTEDFINRFYTMYESMEQKRVEQFTKASSDTFHAILSGSLNETIAKEMNKASETAAPNQHLLREAKYTQEEVHCLKQKQEELMKAIVELNNENKILNDALRHTKMYTEQNSSKKGHMAQCTYEDLINNMDGFRAEDIHGNGHECDIRVWNKDEMKPPVYIELKNYSKPVPKDRIDRFLGDLDNVEGHGIMVVTKSTAQCKGDWHFEFTDKGYVALFLEKVDCNIEKIRSALEFIYSVDKLLVMSKENVRGMSPGQLKEALKCARKVQESYTRQIAYGMKAKKELDKMLKNSHVVMVQTMLVELSTALTRALGDGGDDESETGGEEEQVMVESTTQVLCKFCKKPVANTTMKSRHKNQTCDKISGTAEERKALNMEDVYEPLLQPAPKRVLNLE